MVLERVELGSSYVKQREVRIAGCFVVISEVVIVWPINFGEDYLITEPVFEIVIKLIPVFLEDLAPVALLHVEIKQNKLVWTLVDEVVEVFRRVDHDTLGVFPPPLGLSRNLRQTHGEQED